MVVLKVVAEQSAEVTRVEDDDVVEALAADAADDPLGEGVLPRTSRVGENLFDPHALDAVLERRPVHLIPVADQETGSYLPGERLGDLLGGPVRGRVLGDVEVHNPAPEMSEHEEDEEDLEGHGGDNEEVDGGEVLEVVLQERPPG